MSEDELTQPRETGEPLWPETLGNGLWHVFSHLLSYARERDQLPAAFARYERLGTTLAQLHAPDDMRADAAYNLACLYALAGQRDSALASLRQALTLKPRLAAWARNDDDLVSLRALPEFDQIAPPRDEAAELIAPAALAALRAGPDAPIVVDVRDPEEYAAGHIQGARNIPLSALAARLGELPSEREIITYCNMHHKGASRGEQAAEALREHGHAARAIDGGYPAWQSANLPVETEA